MQSNAKCSQVKIARFGYASNAILLRLHALFTHLHLETRVALKAFRVFLAFLAILAFLAFRAFLAFLALLAFLAFLAF